jgi:hypothetical protein
VKARKTPGKRRTGGTSEPKAPVTDSAVPPLKDGKVRGRTGEGAHSAMREWHEQERKRMDTPPD